MVDTDSNHVNLWIDIFDRLFDSARKYTPRNYLQQDPVHEARFDDLESAGPEHLRRAVIDAVTKARDGNCRPR